MLIQAMEVTGIEGTYRYVLFRINMPQIYDILISDNLSVEVRARVS